MDKDFWRSRMNLKVYTRDWPTPTKLTELISTSFADIVI